MKARLHRFNARNRETTSKEKKEEKRMSMKKTQQPISTEARTRRDFDFRKDAQSIAE